ncbi:SDR family NAD(P)-dependent oxidoreductase [Xanthobacter pseudotagetidis]|uniref:SDR family NAD(P)-dependent oxidoreductase n=1 Tax=Xanthobacter pseudotagetidis TaxID=3119911 RepID=UPI0037266A45
MQLRGKRVLITGGTSGIGLAAARQLQDKGARVFVTGRRPDVLAAALDALGPGARGAAADVAGEAGRAATLNAALAALGGLDVLVNNAGAVRAGRLEETGEAEIRAMVEVDLLAPILLTRAALPALRASGEAMVVNVASGIALVGVPFYATYAAVKAGLAHFGEALRRELLGEGVHVLTLYPGATDTPMMKTSRAGADLGFVKEAADEVAAALVAGMEADALDVRRLSPQRAQMVALNGTDPAALDARFLQMKPALAAAVKDHAAL